MNRDVRGSQRHGASRHVAPPHPSRACASPGSMRRSTSASSIRGGRHWPKSMSRCRARSEPRSVVSTRRSPHCATKLSCGWRHENSIRASGFQPLGALETRHWRFCRRPNLRSTGAPSPSPSRPTGLERSSDFNNRRPLLAPGRRERPRADPPPRTLKSGGRYAIVPHS